jgi:carbon-monoxide dehydrogenase medium subunit
LLARHAGSARVLAGGTDLLVELGAATEGPLVLVDISRVPGLRGIERTSMGLRIGALTTHAELARSDLLRELCPALGDAARAVGAVQTRNLGTLAGNLVSAVPSMDTGPVLLALDASVALASVRGERTLDLAEFFTGPRSTALAPDELLLNVLVPAASLGKPVSFMKFGLRRGQALALVNAAAGFRIDPADNRLLEPRIALGAVAPTVIRAREAERYLSGRIYSSTLIEEAARIAAGEAKPISDFRASAAYRRQIVAVLTRRALDHAWKLAKEAHE